MEKPKHIIIVAGEASGDLHAADLVKEIATLNPSVRFSGLGGQKMRQNGVSLYLDLTKFAVIGFVEVLKNLREIKHAFNLIIEKVKEEKPDAVILVDYPGFNIRLARELKKLNTKVIYYISPQIWAWKENRINIIREVVNKMLVFFEFEKDLYKKHGIDVECIGHPLLDAIQLRTTRESFLNSLSLGLDKLTIGILPGSRKKEIEHLLPVMLKACAILSTIHPNIQFLLLKAPNVDNDAIETLLSKTELSVTVVDQNTYEGINACNICMVASGTATLETAILKKPMVVIYKTSFLTWLLAKLFIKIPYIGLVNVVAGKKIVPECIQFDATPAKISSEIDKILSDQPRIAKITSELDTVKKSLGGFGANRRAAETILRTL